MTTRLGFCVYIFLLFICLTAYADGSGTLSGKVINGFGAPIDGVNVKIEGTDFKAITDNGGNYKINYRPGVTKLIFTKESFTKNIVSVNTLEITDIDFKTVTLWKYPQKGGMYLIKENDYLLINKSSFFAEKDETNLRFIVQGEPSIVNNKDVVILDYEQYNPLVIGKNLYMVYDNNWIGCLGPSEYPLKITSDRYIKIADNIGLRIATLGPGKYLYYTGFVDNRTRKGEGVFFEVRP